jgi:hypothetical protein
MPYADLSRTEHAEDAETPRVSYSRSLLRLKSRLLRLKSSLLRLKGYRRFSRAKGIFNF